MVSKLILEKS